MELSERDDTGHGYAAVRVLPTIRQYWQQDLRRVVNLHSYLYLMTLSGMVEIPRLQAK